MSKKDITADAQNDEPVVNETSGASPEQPVAAADVTEPITPEMVEAKEVVEAKEAPVKPKRVRKPRKKAASKVVAEEAPKDETLKDEIQEIVQDKADAAVAETVAEAPAAAAEPAANIAMEEPAAVETSDETSTSTDVVAEDAQEKASGDAGSNSETDEKPRTRSRGRRSRSRRKPRSGDGDASSETRSSEDKPGSQSSDAPKGKLLATALWGLHKERRAKMVPFAGYEMPVQYKRGIMAEHRQTRDRVGLFDVSHMGQAFLTLEGDGGHNEIAALLEELVPGNIRGLKAGGVRYTLLLNDEGGIIDDFMVTRPEGDAGDGMLFLVVNAGCKVKDFAWISEKLKGRAKLTIAGDRALIALQGPEASKALSHFAPFVAEMPFMTAKACRIDGVECIVSRCGYTGEDGYEISVPNEQAEPFVRKLLTRRDVSLVGLGARDSLRLESGLCLYGHELTEETTPVEANLVWTIAKRRKEDRDFPAAEKIMKQIEDGVARQRVGIRPEGKAPARDGTDIVNSEGKVIGKVTSGGFGPTVRGPIAMGYVDSEASAEGTEVGLMVRGQSRPARVVALPFIAPKQYRPGQEIAQPVKEPAQDPVVEDEATEEDVTSAESGVASVSTDASTDASIVAATDVVTADESVENLEAQDTDVSEQETGEDKKDDTDE